MDTIVLDHGSFNIRAGYANPDNDPSSIIPSSVIQYNEELGSSLETLEKGETVYPIDRGVITEWEAMEDLWHHIFYKLMSWEEGNEGNVFIAEPLFQSKSDREKMVQVMFENFNVQGFYACEQSILSLYAFGKVTGCVVDIGHGKTEIVPIVEGSIQFPISKSLKFGGKDLNQFLLTHLSNHSIKKMDDGVITSMKENMFTIFEDRNAFNLSLQKISSYEYTLPDGQVISTGPERFFLGESFFLPEILNLEILSLPENLISCINPGLPYDFQKQVLENLIFVGAMSTIENFNARFLKEITSLSPPSIRPLFIAAPEYMPENTKKNSAWIGGSILSKLIFPQNQNISKTDYDENGPSIVHKKCF